MARSICRRMSLGVSAMAPSPRAQQRASSVLWPAAMAARIAALSGQSPGVCGGGWVSVCCGDESREKSSIWRGEPVQRMSAMSSRALVQSMAPSRIRAWHPTDEGRSMGPGMAKTVLP